MGNSSNYVLDLRAVDQTMAARTGGKGANLGALCRVGGVRVPAGFCITTDAFKKVMAETPAIGGLLGRLCLLKAADREGIDAISGELRSAIEEAPVPQDIADEISCLLAAAGAETAWAVRSSATAEDLPDASFAGQHDTFLNVAGTASVLRHVSRCWASLFTGRAIVYRMQHGIDHRQVHLAVVVQQMIFPQASGILFTADPVTGYRKVVSIDAGFGLGEALVSGLINADHYKVQDGKITDKQIAEKQLAVCPMDEGGTETREVPPGQQRMPVLTDAQILELAHTGRKIAAGFGAPQDIEWCLAGDVFYIVQSRPITTLYPVPETKDGEPHIYISVGHQQMMTDAMKPLGLSVWQLTTRRPMYEAGGRLFVDVAAELASPAGRETLLNVLGKSDPLIRDALVTLTERDFSRQQTDDPAGKGKAAAAVDYQTLSDYDPTVVADLIRENEAATEAARLFIRDRSGTDLMDAILEDVQQLKKQMADPRSFGVIMTAMNAAYWINGKMKEWLGAQNAADILTRSVPNNITSEMGLALLDVADRIRPYPDMIAYLRQAKDTGFPDELAGFEGGPAALEAIRAYLRRYGMRCAGEIDITRPRWSEQPAMLIPQILNNIRQQPPGAGRRKAEEGRRQAQEQERELLDRLEALPDGQEKAAAARRMIGLVRSFSGYREYPKYHMISRYFIYRQALLEEAARLAAAGVLNEKEDIYYLRFEELREVIRSGAADLQLIGERKEAYRSYEKLRPPRVMTSDGEIITGSYRREDLPPGALAGLPVSAGIAEGRARIVLSMEAADLGDGDILVTPFTDPSWTPLFVSIKGLVTEVGGLMTHGAVIAREYGLPAVVGVENATGLIRDGQRIRVHGTEGYIELL